MPDCHRRLPGSSQAREKEVKHFQGAALALGIGSSCHVGGKNRTQIGASAFVDSVNDLDHERPKLHGTFAAKLYAACVTCLSDQVFTEEVQLRYIQIPWAGWGSRTSG